jgi:hypothetical protein
MAVSAAEEGKQSKQAEQKGDHRAESFSGSAPPDQSLGAGRNFGEGQFAFEVAEHSVHHLDDEGAATECWAAGAATHTPTTAPPVVALVPQLSVVVHIVRIRPIAPACPCLGTDQERAPPIALSA